MSEPLPLQIPEVSACHACCALAFFEPANLPVQFIACQQDRTSSMSGRFHVAALKRVAQVPTQQNAELDALSGWSQQLVQAPEERLPWLQHGGMQGDTSDQKIADKQQPRTQNAMYETVAANKQDAVLQADTKPLPISLQADSQDEDMDEAVSPLQSPPCLAKTLCSPSRSPSPSLMLGVFAAPDPITQDFGASLGADFGDESLQLEESQPVQCGQAPPPLHSSPSQQGASLPSSNGTGMAPTDSTPSQPPFSLPSSGGPARQPANANPSRPPFSLFSSGGSVGLAGHAAPSQLPSSMPSTGEAAGLAQGVAGDASQPTLSLPSSGAAARPAACEPVSQLPFSQTNSGGTAQSLHGSHPSQRPGSVQHSSRSPALRGNPSGNSRQRPAGLPCSGGPRAKPMTIAMQQAAGRAPCANGLAGGGAEGAGPPPSEPAATAAAMVDLPTPAAEDGQDQISMQQPQLRPQQLCTPAPQQQLSLAGADGGHHELQPGSSSDGSGGRQGVFQRFTSMFSRRQQPTPALQLAQQPPPLLQHSPTLLQPPSERVPPTPQLRQPPNPLPTPQQAFAAAPPSSPLPQQQQLAPAAAQPAQQQQPTIMLKQSAKLPPTPPLLLSQPAQQAAPSMQQSTATPQMAQWPLSAATPEPATAMPVPTAASVAQQLLDSGDVQAAQRVRSPARQAHGHGRSIDSEQQHVVSAATATPPELSSSSADEKAGASSQPAAVGTAQARGAAPGGGLPAWLGGSGGDRNTDGQHLSQLLEGGKPPHNKKRQPLGDGFDIVCDFFGIERPSRRPCMTP